MSCAAIDKKNSYAVLTQRIDTPSSDYKVFSDRWLYWDWDVYDLTNRCSYTWDMKLFKSWIVRKGVSSITCKDPLFVGSSRHDVMATVVGFTTEVKACNMRLSISQYQSSDSRGYKGYVTLKSPTESIENHIHFRQDVGVVMWLTCQLRQDVRALCRCWQDDGMFKCQFRQDYGVLRCQFRQVVGVFRCSFRQDVEYTRH